MRQFFKFFLAALLAHLVFWVISSVLLIIAIVGMVVALTAGGGAKPEVSEHTILTISLDRDFSESVQEDDFPNFASLSGDDEKSLTVLQVVGSIEKASTDPNIRAILLKGGLESSFSLEAAERIRKALLSFKKSKKKIYAYADNMSEKSYFVASVADQIVMHPQGNFGWDGMAVRLKFFSKLLKELGIKVQVYYAGNFKSATEQFRLEQMSPYNKEQMQALLDQFNSRMLEQVSASRHLSVAQLQSFADQLSVFNASDAKARGMIDDLLVYDAFKSHVAQEVFHGEKIDEEDIDYLAMEDYTSQFSDEELINQHYNPNAKDEIALLYIDGEISFKGVNEEDYVGYIKDLEKDENIKAVVVRINSPGGSAMISESIWWQLKKLKSKKPVMMSFANVAASGGYYIASAGDSIFASPTTITGSIGVFAMIPSAEKMMKEKLKITFDEVRTSPHASAASNVLTRDLDELEGSRMQTAVDSIYSIFLQRVASGRRMKKSDVHLIAQGRVWTGADAIKNGLVDGLGDEDRALQSAAAKAKLSQFKVGIYPEQTTSWIEKRIQKMASTTLRYIDVFHWLALPNEVKQTADELQGIKESFGVPQMKIPYAMDGDVAVH